MTDSQQSGPDAVSASGPRRGWLLALPAALLALWVAAGVRPLDDGEFGVLEGPLPGGGARRVEGSWTVAPPGLFRLTRYPLHGVELPLPSAGEAMLRAPDGRRFGLRGRITLQARPEAWRRVHAAAAGDGLAGALRSAVKVVGADLASERGALSPTAGRQLERRLIEELDALGIEARRLELDGLDFLALGDDESATPTGTHLLVVGLDGADWAILDPLLEQGRLPNLARLIDNGVRAKLLSISPMLSPVIWTSVATGVEPGRHGILDFLVEDPADGSRQPVTSAQRRVPTAWEMLSRSGVEVGVVGWWASWPADAVRGYLVSDRIAYQLFGFRSDPSDARGKTWPPDLYTDVRPWIVAPEQVSWDDVRPYLSGSRTGAQDYDADERELLDELRTLLASGRSYTRIASELSQRFRPQLEVVYFEGTDTVGHLFMPYRPPRLPGVDARRAESFGQIVDRYYETADAQLGQLLEGRGDEWTVMVISDHGFASDATRPRLTDSRIGHGAAADWHRRFGMLVLSGAHVRAGQRLGEASIYDVAPTVLALFGQPVPASWPGRVLGQALDEAFLEQHPVRVRADDPVREDQLAGAEGLIDPAAADLIAKLRTLGYISGSDDPASTGTESVTARNNAGVALMAEGKYAEAEREFRAGMATSPHAAMLRFNLGVALRFQQRPDEARKLFEEAVREPSTMRMAALMLGQMRIGSGDLNGAEAVIVEVLKHEPGAAELHNLLGWVHERRGDVDRARAEYLTAAELDPDTAMSRNNLGNLAKQQRQLDEAESWYLRAIEADPYFMAAYNNLALIYQDRGQLEKALDLYGRALAKAPNNAELINNVGSWYYASGDLGEARRLWQRATAVDPQYPSPLNNLAGLAITEGQLDEARRLLNSALTLDANYGDARINLAIVHRAGGELDAAREQLRRAAEDPRAQTRAWLQLGMLELERGFVDAAVEALNRAGELTPQNVKVWNALGEAHRLAGRRDEALRSWRRSLSLDPGQSAVRQSLERLAASG